MLKDEFEQKLIQVDRDEKEARKRESEKQPPRSDWGREAFSTRFSCHFCGEVGNGEMGLLNICTAHNIDIQHFNST